MNFFINVGVMGIFFKWIGQKYTFRLLSCGLAGKIIEINMSMISLRILDGHLSLKNSSHNHYSARHSCVNILQRNKPADYKSATETMNDKSDLLGYMKSVYRLMF